MERTLDAEIDRNFDYFQRSLAKFLPKHRGHFALLRDQSVIKFYNTLSEAEAVGESFDDGLYSIQEVTDAPADLGFFTHAFDKSQNPQ